MDFSMYMITKNFVKGILEYHHGPGSNLYTQTRPKCEKNADLTIRRDDGSDLAIYRGLINLIG